MTFKESVELVAKMVEAAGIAVMVGGIALALASFAVGAFRGAAADERYRSLRRGIGRSILLGLELLVAGDIINTVGISPTFTSVGVLAVVVLIRTFLSFTIELELTSRWPWEQSSENAE